MLLVLLVLVHFPLERIHSMNFVISSRCQAQALSNMLAEISLLVLEYLPLNTKCLLLDP